MGLLLSAAFTGTDVTAFVRGERAEPSIVIKDVGLPGQGEERMEGGWRRGTGGQWGAGMTEA